MSDRILSILHEVILLIVGLFIVSYIIDWFISCISKWSLLLYLTIIIHSKWFLIVYADVEYAKSITYIEHSIKKNCYESIINFCTSFLMNKSFQYFVKQQSDFPKQRSTSHFKEPWNNFSSVFDKFSPVFESDISTIISFHGTWILI